ncbi:MAG: hypothetical protein DRG78_03705 [Epsilonproteobacteria bacterium]|nr:MAG: hypothetical protein DRG78_03705 [Campylobacterota bacterium]
MMAQLALSIRDDSDSVTTVSNLKQYFKIHYCADNHIIKKFIDFDIPDRIIVYTEYIDTSYKDQIMDVWLDIKSQELNHVSGYLVWFGTKIDEGGRLMFGLKPPLYDFELSRHIIKAKKFDYRYNL